MKAFIVLIYAIFLSTTYSAKSSEYSEEGFFSGRIAKINKGAALVKVKINFENVKYLNKKDKIEFWDERNQNLKCKSYIVGRTADFLLLKISHFEDCQKSFSMTNGEYFKFYSEDLINNLKMGKEVVDILLKKRLAINGMLDRNKKEMDTHIEKVNTVNARYQTLKEKLEKEWQGELLVLESERNQSIISQKNLERQRDEVDQKLELYKLKDENLTLDRWSLDSHLYFKK